MVRGIEGGKIFRDDKDRDQFLERLENILKDTQTSCLSWALIPNHFHLLLRSRSTPIKTVMRRLLTGYTQWFNRRHKRQGNLFQNRYKSILCQEEKYRYIHLNPLCAGRVKDIGMLGSYKYCGHSGIVGKVGWKSVMLVCSKGTWVINGIIIERKLELSVPSISESVKKRTKDIRGKGV
jgi:REP element-mobilizing transposase RayT